jgi:mRNA-degrading endonuclease YafQ of YafQ-DinJ toxin-antitoxin module
VFYIPLEIPPRFKKQLKDKPPKLQEAVEECVGRLGENPRHKSLQTHQLQGHKGVFEAYVDKANRITFHYE